MNGDPASFPASLIQRQFWVAQQQDPTGSAYNVASGHWIRGALDRVRLIQCIRDVVAHHAVLRGTYGLDDGVLRQCDGGPARLDLREHSVEPGAGARTRAEALLREDAVRPFDLEHGPVVRAVIVAVRDADETAFGLIFHHVAIDLHSNHLVHREIAERYAAAPRVPGPKEQEAPDYAAYARWQSEWLASDAARTSAQYWRDHLARADLAPAYPTDLPRPETRSFRGDRVAFVLPASLRDALQTFSRERALAPYILLLAAYRLLLCRYSQSTSPVIGVPLTNRRLGDFQDTLGCFVNIVPVACDCVPDTGFEQQAQALRQALLQAHRHQELPFTAIVNAVPGSRRTDRNPIFQVGFTQEQPVPLPLPGLDVDSAHIPTGGAQLDLFLRFWTTPAGDFEGQVDYNVALFHRDTIERLVENYLVLLGAALARPTEPGNRLELLGTSDRARIRTINRTEVAYPFVPIHERIAATCRHNPAAPALQFEGAELSYADLDRRANQLAHRLRGMGVHTDTLVGVYMERSLEMVVALYGILKAGGAYVPVDPDYPPERVTYMLRDAAAPVVITQAHLADRLPPTETRQLQLDATWRTIEDEPATPPDVTSKPGDLAYMIYTSGSTGQPKGALNTHRGIDNRLCWMQAQYRMTPADVVMQKTPFSFDVSVWEFFWPLIVGARLVIARPGGHRDPRYIARLIQERGVTILHFVPPMLRHFLEEPQAGACTSLRHVVCSGEALPYDLQEAFFARFTEAQLHNLYGPTEAAVDVTHWTCRRRDPRKIVPIGHPVANTQVHILDPLLQPLPTGVPGELYLGGVQIGRGYHNRPELTAERFLPDVFSQDPDARLYKTGDLCRWLQDGAIEFIGRIDGQVKIRGFRIELGEIEAVARENPDVADAVAFLRDRPGGEKQIIALVAPRTGAAPLEQVRSAMRSRLPDYMQPAALVEVAAIPMLPNGKIDRRALDALVPRIQETPTNGRALEDQTQRTIGRIWEEVLQSPVADADTNFFELGGDSLRLLTVRSRMQQAFGREIELMDMFRSPTIRLLARLVSAGPAAAAAEPPSTRDESRAPAARDRFAARRAKLARDPGTDRS